MPGEDLNLKGGCVEVPSLVSSFVDTFVDFVVGGQFLSSQQNLSSRLRESSKADLQESLGGLKLDENELHGRPSVVSRVPTPERLVAIGDIHGDLGKAREALKIAKVMDENDKWIGGKTVVVQVGDLLDRGGEEIKIIYLLEKLKEDARKHGGDVHIMNGNHEIMNIEGDFRFATPKGSKEFESWAQWYKMGIALKQRCSGLEKPYDFFKNIPEHFPEGLRARMAALRPGGPISSRFLASHPTVLVVGNTVFVHGGLHPSHIEHGIERINEEVQNWILGKHKWYGPHYVHGRDALVWSRKYSEESESKCECDLLKQTLGGIKGTKRMVVGHTIQQTLGINAVCGNQVVRVDVGMSEGCGNGTPEVLEIRGGKELTVISAEGSFKLADAEDLAAYERNPARPGLASLLTPKADLPKVRTKLQTA